MDTTKIDRDLPVHFIGEMLFPLGYVALTRSASSRLSDEDVAMAIGRHVLGDWGDVDEESMTLNDHALRKAGRIVSAYRSGKEELFWVVTEGDRKITALCMEEEYLKVISPAKEEK